uniref:tRNA(Ile)-lysidine synthase, chloroplastic n=1 Tax=Polysiphonia infestans TaxID=2006978 RepID=A0A1Z1MEB4_9FLOR|nr:tRNA Ile-lysidine synthetase [Polysiphonia infestans]ARW64306.1 tRNA Ile-lysidine synthetase [Polysiphonia infestans]
MSCITITKLVKLIKNFINKIKGHSILVAISGGQDSIFLINLLAHLNYEHRIKLSYIYVDHQWKKNSNIQIEHLINYLTIKKKNIIVYQINQVIQSEHECRKQRYQIINQHAVRYKYQIIITGHNSTDKVETFFQNISRKAGVEGISSLVVNNHINNNIFLLRPLLNLNKENIYKLCKKLNLPIWSDSTNYIYSLNRNRIRYELVPYLRNFFNTKIEENLIYSITNHYYENEYIKQNATKVYLANKHKLKIAINYRNLSRQHIILQIKAIQIFYLNNLQIKLKYEIVKKIIHSYRNILSRTIIIFEDKNYLHILNKQWLYIETNNK